MKYRRIKRHISPQIKALADAQKIAFAPLTFQAVAAMLKFGILEFLDENPSDVQQIIENCNVSKYTAETEKRMIEMIEKAGLKVSKKHENVGVHDYTLLECCAHSQVGFAKC